jgi:LCP family protein required for cell wall assembly
MKFKHIVLIIFVVFILLLSYLSYKSKFISNNIHQRRTNFILLGVDFVDNAIHSDTIILLSYNHKSKIFDFISIPRDSYVDIPELKYKKITEVYAYFYQKSKNKLTAARNLSSVIEEKFFDKSIEIPYYIVVDYNGFKEIIDTIGKIKIFVSEPMDYDDYAGGLHIHFSPGIYHMNGEEVLKYVRYRDEKGDIGRIERQQQFVKSFLEKFISPVVWFKLPIIAVKVKQNFHTNINLWELMNMLLEFRNLRLNNIRFSVLPGNPKGRYLELDKETILALTDYLTQVNSEVINKEKRVLIKVYNASSKPKLAKQVAMFLREKGYDVLDWGNWYCKLPKSKIIDYSYNPKILDSFCDMLNIYNISTTYSLYKSSDSINLDLVVILGEDFEFTK